jgi:hypothetical protein
VLSSLEGWPDLLFQVMDGAEEDTGPLKDNSFFMVIFVIGFIVIGNFFCVNMFISMISMQFYITLEQNKNQNLTKQQERWVLMVLTTIF